MFIDRRAGGGCRGGPDLHLQHQGRPLPPGGIPVGRQPAAHAARAAEGVALADPARAPHARAGHRVHPLHLGQAPRALRAGRGDRVHLRRPRRGAAVQRPGARVLCRARLPSPSRGRPVRGEARRVDRRQGMGSAAQRRWRVARATRRRTLFCQGAAIVLAVLLTTLVLLAAQAPPLAAYANIVLGAVGSWEVAANVLVSWVPLLLATAGLLITFTAGLWNIGIEGQITLGAIFTTWMLRGLQSSGVDPSLVIALSIARRNGWRRPLGPARRRAEDVRRRERDLRRARPELRGLRPQPLAHLRPVEAPGGGFDVRDRALRPVALAAHALRAVPAEPVGPRDRGPRDRCSCTCCSRGRISGCA